MWKKGRTAMILRCVGGCYLLDLETLGDHVLVGYHDLYHTYPYEHDAEP
jgi:hypothetical protein